MTLHRFPDRRRAFTLIELLVVVAIVAILVGLSAGAYFKVISLQNERNTKATLHKLHTAVANQWSEALRAAYASGPDANTQATIINSMSPNNDNVARALWVKFNMRKDFPMTYAEALDPTIGFNLPGAAGSVKPHDAYVKILKGRTRANDPTTESAACLLMALKFQKGGMRFSVEDALGPGSIADTDNDGIPEIVDGWGKAIIFVRWGWANPDLDALARNQGTLDRDVEDPDHALMNINWNVYGSASVADFERLYHKIQNENGSPRSYYTMPTIVSAGRDGQFGLDLHSMAATDLRLASDNLYSFKIR